MYPWLILIIVAVALYIVWSNKQRVSALDFTNKYCEKVKKIDPNFSTEIVGPLEVKITTSDSDYELMAGLDNAYCAYRQNPEELDSIFEQFAGFLKDGFPSSKPTEIDPDRIVPVLKNLDYVESTKEQMKGASEGNLILTEPLTNDLFILYALDLENGLQFLSRAEAETIELASGTLRDKAASNLERKFKGLEMAKNEGLYVLSLDGNSEASCILVDGLWNKEFFNVKGDFVVAIPSRDVLIITGSEENGGILEAQNLAKKIFADSGYAISDRLFVRKEGRWIPFGP